MYETVILGRYMWRIIGQTKTVAFFQGNLMRGRLAHAYLFVGPPHVGKMTLALDLAQALNCKGDTPPCGECSICRRIVEGKHPDVQIIGIAGEKRTEVSIDQIRVMQAAACLPPFEGTYKVFIIDGAESLSAEAANCLLKTLEEPFPQCVFFLLTTLESAVLLTVVSRCQRIRMHPSPRDTVKDVLVQHHHLADDQAEVVSRLSKGCIGWALGAIRDDQVLKERSQRVQEIIHASQADINGRLSYAAELANEFSKSRKHAEEVLDVWLDWWRDILLVNAGGSESIINVDYKSVLFEWAQQCTLSGIKDFIQSLLVTKKQIGQNANPRLVLEMLMLNMPQKAIPCFNN